MAHKTTDMLTGETPDFISPTLWLPDTPDINPVDYKVRLVMQEKVYQKRIKDIDELRSRKLRLTDELDRRAIDTAIKQWVAHASSCVFKSERRTF